MDYKEKYENLRKTIEHFHKIANQGLKRIIEYYIPEINENIEEYEDEDERVRRCLLSHFSRYQGGEIFINGITMKQILAWIEKQGQKPADKVEPRFKVGDWVVPDKSNAIYHIDGISDEISYCMTCINGDKFRNSIKIVDNYSHLWTIEDARAGDVLADGVLPFIFKRIDSMQRTYAYCGISVDDGFKVDSEGTVGEWTWMTDLKPATKEQHDLLFQKMKEAGYEWDAEKKELKEIEQNPTWSEEDDITCMMYWDSFKGIVGKGYTAE